MTILLAIMLYLLAGGIYMVILTIFVVSTMFLKYGIEKTSDAAENVTEASIEDGSTDSGWTCTRIRNLFFWPVCYTINAIVFVKEIIAICEEQ